MRNKTHDAYTKRKTNIWNKNTLHTKQTNMHTKRNPAYIRNIIHVIRKIFNMKKNTHIYIHKRQMGIQKENIHATNEYKHVYTKECVLTTDNTVTHQLHTVTRKCKWKWFMQQQVCTQTKTTQHTCIQLQTKETKHTQHNNSYKR